MTLLLLDCWLFVVVLLLYKFWLMRFSMLSRLDVKTPSKLTELSRTGTCLWLLLLLFIWGTYMGCMLVCGCWEMRPVGSDRYSEVIY